MDTWRKRIKLFFLYSNFGMISFSAFLIASNLVGYPVSAPPPFPYSLSIIIAVCLISGATGIAFTEAIRNSGYLDD